jgi:hypothetical protein
VQPSWPECRTGPALWQAGRRPRPHSRSGKRVHSRPHHFTLLDEPQRGAFQAFAEEFLRRVKARATRAACASGPPPACARGP